jgi:phosphoribosylglycinamide formyltransferase-1
MDKKLVFLISGSGSNLQAFIDAVEQHTLKAKIALVISNKAGVKGLERAQNAQISTAVLEHVSFPDRLAFDRALIALIDRQQPDAVILAGFMRILTPEFVSHYEGKLFNIHPSLLPKYPGLHTHQRAIDNGDTLAGASVHFVVPELDAGPLVVQASVPVLPGDDASTLAHRVLMKEHIIYPMAIRWFLENRLRLTPKGAELDGSLLPPQGFSCTG